MHTLIVLHSVNKHFTLEMFYDRKLDFNQRSLASMGLIFQSKSLSSNSCNNNIGAATFIAKNHDEMFHQIMLTRLLKGNELSLSAFKMSIFKSTTLLIKKNRVQKHED